MRERTKGISESSKRVVTGALLGMLLLEGCGITIDSYLNDASAVQCDGRRTTTDLKKNSIASFIIHGTDKSGAALVSVIRQNTTVSMAVHGVTDQPTSVENLDYSDPTDISDGSEFSFAAVKGVWLVDVRGDQAIIQGNCS